MTTSDSRPVDERRPLDGDELEVTPEEQAYTPPDRDAGYDEPVQGEVVDPPADPTPPDVAPQAAPTDPDLTPEAADDLRPDASRAVDGHAGFEPLQVPVIHEDGRGDGRGDDDRWRAIQVRFVDDPTGAVQEAEAFVEEALATLREGYESGDTTGDSTERLRRTLRRYRSVHQAVSNAED